MPFISVVPRMPQILTSVYCAHSVQSDYVLQPYYTHTHTHPHTHTHRDSTLKNGTKTMVLQF